jgi:antitoxin PrlF
MKLSKLNKKYQATIPKVIRELLYLSRDNVIGFEIENNRVFLRKISIVDHEWQRSIETTLSEWVSTEDDDAYSSL